jgi:hypothetical protein
MPPPPPSTRLRLPNITFSSASARLLRLHAQACPPTRPTPSSHLSGSRPLLVNPRRCEA